MNVAAFAAAVAYVRQTALPVVPLVILFVSGRRDSKRRYHCERLYVGALGMLLNLIPG